VRFGPLFDWEYQLCYSVGFALPRFLTWMWGTAQGKFELRVGRLGNVKEEWFSAGGKTDLS
jgi:hypothetical protein